MNIVRMALISPHAVSDGRAVSHRRITETRSARDVKRVIQRTRRPRRAAWRQALIEAYPIVGMALFLAYFVWLLVSHIHFAG